MKVSCAKGKAWVTMAAGSSALTEDQVKQALSAHKRYKLTSLTEVTTTQEPVALAENSYNVGIGGMT